MHGAKTDGPAWKDAYDPAEFAAKHGLTVRQATVVLVSNGPSKKKCDLAALAFAQALKQFGRNRPIPEASGRRSSSRRAAD